MDGTQPSNQSGMISGGVFAGMIIIGGIVGDIILYTYLYNALGGVSSFPIIFVLGIILVIIAVFMIQKATKVSRLLYWFIFLGCMGVPLFGGFVLYIVAKLYHLTL
jgi:hypothetical protein